MIINASNTVIQPMILTGSASTLSALMGMGDYLPYLVGGIVLYGYLLTTKQVVRSPKSAVLIIAGAILVGWGTKDLVGFLAEILEHTAITYFAGMEDIVEKASKIKESVVNTVSVVLAGLSFNVYHRFFGNSNAFLDVVIRKVKKQGGLDEQ